MKVSRHSVFLAAAFAAICVPLAAKTSSSLLGWPVFAPFPTALEKRHKALFPRVRETPLPRFGAAVDAWYGDNYAWRTRVVTLFRGVNFHWLKSPVGREVPGAGRWIFRRGGDWAELDDYLGALSLPDERAEAWRELLEGRREWARAHGARFLTLVTSLKAQIRPDRILQPVRGRRGRGVSARFKDAIAGSPAREDVVFVDDALRAAVAGGAEAFYETDHHLDAYGSYVVYDRLNAELRRLFPGRLGEMPWYPEGEVPPAVARGEAPGCWPVPDVDADGVEIRRLAVSAPGERQTDAGLVRNTRRYPYSNVATEREGGGLSVLMGHDSYMRFSFDSWRGAPGDVRFPFAPGVGSVKAYIFQRFTTGFLEEAFCDGVPDVIVEQFPEQRLADGPVGLDATMRAAVRFSRGIPLDGPAAVPSSRKAGVLAVFEGVEAGPDALAPRKKGQAPRLVATLSRGGKGCCSVKLPPGPRRAVFFPPVAVDAYPPGPFEVSLSGGTARSTRIEVRDLAAPSP